MSASRWAVMPASQLKRVAQPWMLAALLVGLAPALHTIATWDLDGQLSPQAYAFRHHSYLIVLVELCMIWLAARQGLSISRALEALPRHVLIPLVIWSILAIAALFSTSSGLANAAFMLGRYAIHGFFFIALVHLIRVSADFEIRRWLTIISVGAVLYVALLIFFCLIIPNPAEFAWQRRLPSATNIRQIANVVGILAVAPLALLLGNRDRSLWLPALAFIFVFAFTTWTGSRATILGLAVGIAAGFILVKNFTNIRNVVATGVSAVAAIFVSLPMPIPDPSFGLYRLVVSNVEKDDVSSGRTELWVNTWQEIVRSPWIGHGAGRFRSDMGAIYGTQFNHPHNFILQYLYDWGFIGGSAAVLLLAIFGLTILGKREVAPVVRFTAITAFCAICCMAMIDTPLFYPLPMMLALALIAPAFGKTELRTR
jgi:O-antigen ligase